MHLLEIKPVDFLNWLGAIGLTLQVLGRSSLILEALLLEHFKLSDAVLFAEAVLSVIAHRGVELQLSSRLRVFSVHADRNDILLHLTVHRALNGRLHSVDLAHVRLLALYRLDLSLDCCHLFEQILFGLRRDARGDRSGFLSVATALFRSFLDLNCLADTRLGPR